MPTRPLQTFYGVLAIVGIIVTWYFNIQPREISYLADLYATSASASFTNDLLVVVLAFLVWSYTETARLKMSYKLWGIGVVLTFGIAAAFTVPAFLLLRERRLVELESEHQ